MLESIRMHFCLLLKCLQSEINASEFDAAVPLWTVYLHVVIAKS